jgi:hypothetical protein
MPEASLKGKAEHKNKKSLKKSKKRVYMNKALGI